VDGRSPLKSVDVTGNHDKNSSIVTLLSERAVPEKGRLSGLRQCVFRRSLRGRKARKVTDTFIFQRNLRRFIFLMADEIDCPNFTTIPNILLDNIHKFSNSEFKVLMYACRKTFGFHEKESVVMSISYLENGVGLSNVCIIKACASLVDRGFLLKEKSDKFNGASAYKVNVKAAQKQQSDTPLNNLTGKDCLLKILTPTCEESSQVPIKNLHTSKETISKETIKETITPIVPIPIVDPVQEAGALWRHAFTTITGNEYRRDIKDCHRKADAKEISFLIKGGMTPKEIGQLAERVFRNTKDWHSKQTRTIKKFCNWIQELEAENPPDYDPNFPGKTKEWVEFHLADQAEMKRCNSDF